MDLGSLANLSLAEIASMLNTKQQEVLLASISVAARFIQQLQAEDEQLQGQANQQQNINTSNSNNNNNNQTNTNTTATSNAAQNARLKLDAHQQMHQHQLSNNYHIHHLKHEDTSQDDDSQYEDDDDDDDDDMDHMDPSMTSFEEHNSTTDAQTLRTIRHFAEELKVRRKSIRLSQKGAAQSLRAFTSGEHPCTDAIIYHFENLQLEPERAMQLIPLLKDWLDWAEKHRLEGKQLPMMGAVTKVPRERKRKVVLFNEKAKQYLEDAFLKNNHPDRYQLDVISQELNIPTRSIRKWFTNRRQRKRFAEKFNNL